MSGLIASARDTVQQVAALLWEVTEDGDLVAFVAEALTSGHVLFVVADDPNSWLAEETAAALRRGFVDEAWPPVFSVVPDSGSLSLFGRDYGVDHPLRLQCEILMRAGDVVLLLPGAEATEELLDVAAIAAARHATVASLGPALPDIEASPHIALPHDNPGVLTCSQLGLAHAFAAALTAALPAAPPADLRPAVEFFRCANCSHPLTVPSHIVGRLGTCPYCHNNTTLGSSQALADGDPRRRMRFALRDCELHLALAPPDLPSTPIQAQTQLENLSRGGLLVALINSPVDVQPDDTLLVQIHVPAFEQPLELLGNAARVTREGSIQHVGILFVSLEPTVAERLRILEENVVLRNVVHRPRPTA